MTTRKRARVSLIYSFRTNLNKPERYTTKQVGRSLVFFAWAGSTKPEIPVRDNKYHDSGYQLSLLTKSVLLRALRVFPLDASFNSSSAQNGPIVYRLLQSRGPGCYNREL